MIRMTRRRFVTIAAVAAAMPARAAEPAIWNGRALGADARIVLIGADPQQARHLFAKVEAEIAHVDSAFS